MPLTCVFVLKNMHIYVCTCNKSLQGHYIYSYKKYIQQIWRALSI